MTDQRPPVPAYDFDWLDALRHTALSGLAAWVTNDDDRVVDATPDTARAMGIPISEYIGSSRNDPRWRDRNVHPPAAEREARLAKVLSHGGSDTFVVFGSLADRGWTRYIVTARRLVHPDGRKYLLNIAHDVTEIDNHLDYLRAPAFQGMLMLIAEQDGTCLAATDAAAKLCGFEHGMELQGRSIVNTAYQDLVQREREEVNKSRVQEKPAHAVEWLESPSGAILPYAVSRIGFPRGCWMVIMQPISLDAPYFQKPIEAMLEAPNFNVPATVTQRQLDCLVDLQSGLSLKTASIRRSVTQGAVSALRNAIAAKFRVGRPAHILPALRGTPLGMLVLITSQMVNPEPPEVEAN